MSEGKPGADGDREKTPGARLVREGARARVVGPGGSWLLDHDLSPWSTSDEQRSYGVMLFSTRGALWLVMRTYVSAYGVSSSDAVFVSRDGGATFVIDARAEAPAEGFIERLDFE